MPRPSLKTVIALLFISLVPGPSVFAEGKERMLTLYEFVAEAARKDTAFQEILIDELKLRYERELTVDARDFVLSIESQYDYLYYPYDHDSETTISLSKLFPYYGASVEAEYSSSYGMTSRNITSDLEVKFSQSIAENAFGRNTRILDKIAGIEVEVAGHQVVEAYEDYLAELITAYYNWYSAYEDLKTGEASYDKSLELLENIEERARSNIALPIDVNKSALQAADKKENLVTLVNTYNEYLSIIEAAIRYEENDKLIPEKLPSYAEVTIDFEKDYDKFWKKGRTSLMLKLLEEKSGLEVDRYADELLPSIDVFTGYSVMGNDHDLEDQEHLFFIGTTLDWPLPGEEEIANYRVSRIDRDKAKLTTKGTYFELYTTLKNTAIRIERERNIIEIAKEKIELSEKIVKDEQENYSLGRSSLNDLIDEINKLEDNRFNKISHEVQLRKEIIEWLRLTDTLVKKRLDITTKIIN